MDELLSLSEESCFRLGANPQQLQQQELLSSPSRHRTRTRAIHASLRNRTMVLSSLVTYFASVLLLWATWAVWRLRKSWVEAIAWPRRPEELPDTTSDLARFECPLVDEAGSTPGPPFPEKNLLASPILKTGVDKWQRPLQMPRPPPVSVPGPHQGGSMSSDFASHDHHMIGLPSSAMSALNQTWPANTACDDIDKELGSGVATATPEESPPSSTYGVLACGLEGGTAPASPESDRCCTRKSTISSSAERTGEIVAPVVLRSAGNTSSSCGLCGYTLEEGQEVVRSPACAQGFMVSRREWDCVVCAAPRKG